MRDLGLEIVLAVVGTVLAALLTKLLVGKQRAPVKLSLLLIGLPEFARTVLAEAPAGSIDAETHSVLQQVAAGYLPEDD